MKAAHETQKNHSLKIIGIEGVNKEQDLKLKDLEEKLTPINDNLKDLEE